MKTSITQDRKKGTEMRVMVGVSVQGLHSSNIRPVRLEPISSHKLRKRIKNNWTLLFFTYPSKKLSDLGSQRERH